WACSIVARVGSFFSPHARRKYYLDDVTEAVWDWTQKGRSARARCRRLLDRLNEVDNHFDFPAVSDGEHDEEGYSHGFATLGICLLNEMERDDGGPASTAAFDAAQCYAAHILYGWRRESKVRRSGGSSHEPSCSAVFLSSLPLDDVKLPARISA